jgi:hypothetical protein
MLAAQWQEAARAHEERVRQWIEPHLARRARREKHPVNDFLFEYYGYPPAALRRWHPGFGVELHGDVAGFAAVRGFVVDGERARVDPALAARRADQVRWIRELLLVTDSRPPRLSCFGLHEWAMVYRSTPDELRHTQLPLRLGHDGTDEVVARHRITCSHYDAYRFFTPAARPLNQLSPTLESRVGNEQPGCLHVGMDSYKWAHKLAPFTSADLVADCFELALAIREVDMRASPYDLTAHGYAPIPVETAEGKAAYIALQQDFARRGSALRQRIVAVCDSVLAA